MKLIAGLGNPGTEYRGTRHNVGYMVVDEVGRRHRLALETVPSEAPENLIARISGPEQLLVAKPLTFMNRSGDAIGALMRYFAIDPADLLVVVDDAALPFGRLRARARGSDGGHHGLASVIAQLGTAEFARLRLGVGRGDPQQDLADHVLSEFEPEEQSELEGFIARAADAAEMFAAEGIDRVMNTCNPDTAGPDVD